MFNRPPHTKLLTLPIFFEVRGQFGFTPPIAGQRQKIDRHAARGLLADWLQA